MPAAAERFDRLAAWFQRAIRRASAGTRHPRNCRTANRFRPGACRSATASRNAGRARSRMPLVLIITMSIGWSQAYLKISQKLRVDRRLAAGKLQHLRPALGRHEAVDRPAAIVERQDARRPGPLRGIAHRAFQVARRRDLEHAQARVLLVLGAQAAIERAAAARTRRQYGRALCRA